MNVRGGNIILNTPGIPKNYSKHTQILCVFIDICAYFDFI